MIGVYNYTVIATYLSLLSSVLGIYFGCSGRTFSALLCLMLSGALDAFDGKIASMKKDRTVQEKRFGIQLDSLCDLVCFGVLPCVIGYSGNEELLVCAGHGRLYSGGDFPTGLF